jgi:cardiolipin synthase
MTEVFEKDLGESSAYTLQRWRGRPWTQKAAEIVLIPLRSQL